MKKLLLCFLNIILLICAVGCNQNVVDNECIEEGLKEIIFAQSLEKYVYPAPTDYDSIKNEILNDRLSLYLFEPNLDNVSYVCGYSNEYNYTMNYDVEDIVWKKYTYEEDILNKYRGLENVFTYVLIDGTITYDLYNDVELNYPVCYIRNMYEWKKDNPFLKNIDTYFLVTKSVPFIEEYTKSAGFNKYPLVINYYDLNDIKPIIEENGKKYLKLPIKTEYYENDELKVNFHSLDFMYSDLQELMIDMNNEYEIDDEGYKRYYKYIKYEDLILRLRKN